MVALRQQRPKQPGAQQLGARGRAVEQQSQQRLRSAALGSGMMFGKIGAASASPLVTTLPLLTSLGISGGLLFAAAAGATTLPDSKAAGKASSQG